MGMKKNTALSLMYFAMAMGGTENFGLAEQGSVDISKPYNPPLKPFKEQDGIVTLIKDYNLIQKKLSKKGKRKQLRIVTKINELLKNGYLTKDDLNKVV